MVMLKDQMFRRQPTMFAGGTPNRINDPRTAIGAAQGGGLNAPTQTIGGAFGGMLPPVSMPLMEVLVVLYCLIDYVYKRDGGRC